MPATVHVLQSRLKDRQPLAFTELVEKLTGHAPRTFAQFTRDRADAWTPKG